MDERNGSLRKMKNYCFLKTNKRKEKQTIKNCLNKLEKTFVFYLANGFLKKFFLKTLQFFTKQAIFQTKFLKKLSFSAKQTILLSIRFY